MANPGMSEWRRAIRGSGRGERGRGTSARRSAMVMMRAVERMSPRDEGELLALVESVFGLRLPSKAMVEGNALPGDYLAHAFFERRPGDCIVWANRGGGKTMMGALATLLDLLFKPGIRVRILGGSLEQSSKMYEHLVRFARTPGVRSLVSREPTLRSLSLVNGSQVEILAQSERSVRGTRVHKLRCDEVEEFRPEIWRAAQMVTRAEAMRVEGMELEIGGTIEAMSTAHRATGLMSRLIAARGVRVGEEGAGETRETASVDRGRAVEGASMAKGLLRGAIPGAVPGAALFRWCALDVIERCLPEVRACKGCALWDECGGRAREADGFLKIEDVIRQRERISKAAWSSEMMCRRPRVEDGVYAGFDAEAGGRHVVAVSGAVDQKNPGLRHRNGSDPACDAREREPAMPNEQTRKPALKGRAWEEGAASESHGASSGLLVAGVDFGIRSPMVMLWAVVRDGVIEVIDEYVARGMTLERNLDAAESRGHGMPAWVGIDPAGQSLNSQSGESDAAVLRRRGYRVRALRLGLREGVELVRARLDRQTLRIREDCVDLIESLATYHFDEARPANESPVKDGPDHVCDALRYLVQNLDAGTGKVTARGY